MEDPYFFTPYREIKSSKKEHGESVFDPVYVLTAVLGWADIANNEHGKIVLTASYKTNL